MAADPGDEVRWRLYLDALRTWLPLVISICAISLTVFQAMSTRKHARLSVQPRMDWRLSEDGDSGEVRITMINAGFGPAIVTDVVFFHGETEIGPAGFPTCDRLDGLLGRAGDDWDTACFVMSDEYVLRPGDEALIYASVAAPELSPEEREDKLIDFEKVMVEIRYCSLYEDCWRLQKK